MLKIRNMKEKKLKKSEIDLINLTTEKHLTICGKLSILELNKLLGNPVAVKKLAKIEVITGSTVNPTIVVERYIDGELRYSNGITIRNIKISMISKVESLSLITEYIRKPDYNPAKLPKATKKEMKDYIKRILSKT